MSIQQHPLISVTVPLHNESEGIVQFHTQLIETIRKATHDSFEIIYCDDGSTDTTADEVKKLCNDDARIKLLRLSRNFGKENALSAAIHLAAGQAIIMLDGDGQHPISSIPNFIAAWENGAQVVIGLRSDQDTETFVKRFGSWAFYKLFNRLTGQKLIPGATDYRLIDRTVQQAFLSLTETDRITRGLIDWLGFKRTFVPIKRITRATGVPSYSLRKLITLAMNSFVSLSPAPLYLFGYIGIIITTVALLLGLSIFTEQIIFHDPWHWHFTGSAMLGILLLFFVGIILISQGIISLYISTIHNQTKGRPLYVIDYHGSAGISKDNDV